LSQNVSPDFAIIIASDKREAIKRRDTGNETPADIGRSYNVSPATISRLCP